MDYCLYRRGYCSCSTPWKHLQQWYLHLISWTALCCTAFLLRNPKGRATAFFKPIIYLAAELNLMAFRLITNTNIFRQQVKSFAGVAEVNTSKIKQNTCQTPTSCQHNSPIQSTRKIFDENQLFCLIDLQSKNKQLSPSSSTLASYTTSCSDFSRFPTTQSQNNWVWQRPLDSSSPISCSNRGSPDQLQWDFQDHTRCLLAVSKHGDSTTSLDNLLQHSPLQWCYLNFMELHLWSLPLMPPLPSQCTDETLTLSLLYTEEFQQFSQPVLHYLSG